MINYSPMSNGLEKSCLLAHQPAAQLLSKNEQFVPFGAFQGKLEEKRRPGLGSTGKDRGARRGQGQGAWKADQAGQGCPGS